MWADYSTCLTNSVSLTNTLVIYSTDNGPHMNSWPDAAMTPFRSEKNTNWEGAFQRPMRGPLAWRDSTRNRL